MSTPSGSLSAMPNAQATPEVLLPTELLPESPFMSSSNLLIISALVALLLIAAVFIVRRRSTQSKSGSTVLILGPSDAGKTAIMTALTYGHALPTHTSLQPNLTLYTPSSESADSNRPQQTLRLVDVPGHPRIRGQFADYMSDVKAVVFVVDSSTIARNGAAVAEHLHTILTAIMALPPTQTPPSILIHAHKSDLLNTTARSTPSQASSRTTTILERELEKRRTAHLGGVNVEGMQAIDGAESAGSGGDGDGMSGLECAGPSGGSFRFAEWEGGEVSIGEGWVRVERGDGVEEKGKGKVGGLDEKKGGVTAADGLDGLKTWLESLP